jgi:LysM repeat protein
MAMNRRSSILALVVAPLLFVLFTGPVSGGWAGGGGWPHSAAQFGLDLARLVEVIPSVIPATIAGRPPVLAGELEAAAPPEPTTHIVQPGENLYLIAEFYGVTVQDLVRANDIPNANRIWAGQMLIIPAPGSALSAAAQPTGTGLLPGDQVTLYSVQPGDTMNGLAERFGIPVWQLAEANDIANPNRLYAGQVLAIPTHLLDTGLLLTANPAPVVVASSPPAESDPVTVTAVVPPDRPAQVTPRQPGAGVTVSSFRAEDSVYFVVEGDTLSEIAFNYETTVWVLTAANSLTNPNFLYIGQPLVVSGPTVAQAALLLAMGGLPAAAPAGTVAAGVMVGAAMR